MEDIHYRDAGDQGEQDVPRVVRKPNIVIMGAMGSGKSTVGWLLARLIGYGFVDLDHRIEAQEKKTVDEIFNDLGESRFRDMESGLIRSLQGIRSHIISVGGGAVMDEENWEILTGIANTIWINPPATEIARRLATNEAELKKRPLLAELVTHKDIETRTRLLSERMSALIGNRSERYKQAELEISDSFATPESTAHLCREILVRQGYLDVPKGLVDRWSFS